MKNISLTFKPSDNDFYAIHRLINDLIQNNGTESEYERFKFNLDRLHNDYPPNSDRNLNQFSPKRNAEIFQAYIGDQKVSLNLK